MRANEFLTEEQLDELNWKNALITGALAATTALGSMSPAHAGSGDMDLYNAIYNRVYQEQLVKHKDPDGQLRLDRRDQNRIKAIAQDKAQAEFQQRVSQLDIRGSQVKQTQSNFPSQRSEVRRAADFDKF